MPHSCCGVQLHTHAHTRVRLCVRASPNFCSQLHNHHFARRPSPHSLGATTRTLLRTFYYYLSIYLLNHPLPTAPHTWPQRPCLDTYTHTWILHTRAHRSCTRALAFSSALPAVARSSRTLLYTAKAPIDTHMAPQLPPSTHILALPQKKKAPGPTHPRPRPGFHTHYIKTYTTCSIPEPLLAPCRARAPPPPTRAARAPPLNANGFHTPRMCRETFGCRGNVRWPPYATPTSPPPASPCPVICAGL